MLANYCIDEMVTTEPEMLPMPFNWKVFAENFMDAYHSLRLHASLYDFTEADTSSETLLAGTFPPLEPGSIGIGGRGRTGFKDRGMNPTQATLFPPIPTLDDDDRWNVVYLYVAPSLLIGAYSDSVKWLAVQPVSAGESLGRLGYLFPESTTKLKLFDQLLEQHKRGVELFYDQDMPVAVASQRGMGSRFAPQGPLSGQDFFRSQLAEWLLERYSTADAAGVLTRTQHCAYAWSSTGRRRPSTSRRGRGWLDLLRDRLGLIGTKESLRPGRLRSVHGAGRRPGCAFVPGAGRAGGRAGANRRRLGRRRLGSAGGLRRLGRAAVRVLHARTDGAGLRASSNQASATPPSLTTSGGHWAGNFCRCTGYNGVVAAVQKAAAGRAVPDGA